MLKLSANTREEKNNYKLRKEGILPAVVYGKDLRGLPLQLSLSDFEKVYKEAGESTIITLKIEDKNRDYPVLIREIQKDPITGRYLHADFYQLPMDEEVEVTVPIEFEGIAPAEKELGGVLIKNIHEVEIRALPKDLIHSVKVDVSSLATFEDEIKIKDLNVPKEVKILADSEEVVALVSKAEEEVEEIPAEEEKEKIEEIEVVGKKKEEEGTSEEADNKKE